MSESMNLGEQMRVRNVLRAFAIVDSLKRDDFGVLRYSRNKELAKWQAVADILAREVRRLSEGKGGSL